MVFLHCGMVFVLCTRSKKFCLFALVHCIITNLGDWLNLNLESHSQPCKGESERSIMVNCSHRGSFTDSFWLSHSIIFSYQMK